MVHKQSRSASSLVIFDLSVVSSTAVIVLPLTKPIFPLAAVKQTMVTPLVAKVKTESICSVKLAFPEYGLLVESVAATLTAKEPVVTEEGTCQ